MPMEIVSPPPPPLPSVEEEEESRRGYIEHPVSNLDTLVGIAIKYGVEVADIKRLNGLVTDLQMFAHKTLKIPLSGRHPPSTHLPVSHSLRSSSSPPLSRNGGIPWSNNNEKQNCVSSSSSSMCLLKGYYGLWSSSGQTHRAANNGFGSIEETLSKSQEKSAKEGVRGGVVRRRGGKAGAKSDVVVSSYSQLQQEEEEEEEVVFDGVSSMYSDVLGGLITSGSDELIMQFEKTKRKPALNKNNGNNSESRRVATIAYSTTTHHRNNKASLD